MRLLYPIATSFFGSIEVVYEALLIRVGIWLCGLHLVLALSEQSLRRPPRRQVMTPVSIGARQLQSPLVDPRIELLILSACEIQQGDHARAQYSVPVAVNSVVPSRLAGVGSRT